MHTFILLSPLKHFRKLTGALTNVVDLTTVLRLFKEPV